MVTRFFSTPVRQNSSHETNQVFFSFIFFLADFIVMEGGGGGKGAETRRRDVKKNKK